MSTLKSKLELLNPPKPKRLTPADLNAMTDRQLLLLAADDLEALSSDPRLRINLHEWVGKYTEELCIVCAAGAVIVHSLNRGIDNTPLTDNLWAEPRRHGFLIGNFITGAIERISRLAIEVARKNDPSGMRTTTWVKTYNLPVYIHLLREAALSLP